MDKFIEHPFIKPNKIQARIYQQVLFVESIKKNSLIILPTGLGKTVIMIMVVAYYLNKYPGKKIIIAAPTRPLIDQHFNSFKDKLDLIDTDIIILSGNISPKKRGLLWKNNKIIITTPQTLRNDIISEIFDLENVSLICFDEAHRAIGNDAYVLAAEQYKKKNPNGRILGFTASPRNIDKLREIIKNLGINNVQYMDETNPQVKPYIYGSDKNYIWIELPEDIIKIKNKLTEYAKDNLQILKNLNIVDSILLNKNPKKELIKIPGKINNNKLKMDENDFYSAMSSYGQLMLTTQAIEMLETQGLKVLKLFFDNKFEKFKINEKKSIKRFLTNPKIQQVIKIIDNLLNNNFVDPKIMKLIELVKKELNTNKDARILIFTNYKATTELLVSEIKILKEARVHKFVGQSNTLYGKGLSQSEQKRIMDAFRSGEYNILVSTSVGEEGIDVAECDLVIFYDITPSSTRLIQRSGRTGRARRGKVIFLIAKGTRDESYYYISQAKKNKIKFAVNTIIKEINDNNKKSNSHNLDEFFEEKPISKTIDNQKNSKNIDKNKIEVIIDFREKGSGLIRELMKLKINIKQEKLPIGDFILSDRIGIERKSISDFCISVINKNIFNQIIMLKNTYQKPLLLIEGELLNSSCSLSSAAYQGALLSIMIDFNIPIVFAKNYQETATILYSIAKKEQIDNKRKIKIYQPSTANSLYEEQINLLAAIPKINVILAERLLQNFKTPANIFNASIDELRKVHGIGYNIAKMINDIINKDPNIDI